VNVLLARLSVVPLPAGEGTLDGVGVGRAEEPGEPLGAAGVGVAEGAAGWLAPPLGVAGAAGVDAAADGLAGRAADLAAWAWPAAGAAAAEPPWPGVPWLDGPPCRARLPCGALCRAAVGRLSAGRAAGAAAGASTVQPSSAAAPTALSARNARAGRPISGYRSRAGNGPGAVSPAGD